MQLLAYILLPTVSFLLCGRPYRIKLFQDECVRTRLTVDGLPTFRHVIFMHLEVSTNDI
jgi:hypothetical protein